MSRAKELGLLAFGLFCTAIASMGPVDPCLGKDGQQSCSYVGSYKLFAGVLAAASFVGAIAQSQEQEEDEFQEFKVRALNEANQDKIAQLYADRELDVAEVMAEEAAMQSAGIPLTLPASNQTPVQPVQALPPQPQTVEALAQSVPAPANSFAIQPTYAAPMTIANPTPVVQVQPQIALPDGAKLIEATALEDINEYPVVMVIANMGAGKTSTMRWIFSRLSGLKAFSSHKAEIEDLKKFDLCFGYCPQTDQSRWIGDQNTTITTPERDLTWIRDNQNGIGTVSEFIWGVFAEISNRQKLGGTRTKALPMYRAFFDEASFAYTSAYSDPLNPERIKWGQSLVAGSNKLTFMDARTHRVQMFYAAQGEAVETIGLRNMSAMRDDAWHLYPGNQAIIVARKAGKHQLAQWLESRLAQGYAIALLEKQGVFFHVLNLPLISELDNTPDVRQVGAAAPAQSFNPAPIPDPFDEIPSIPLNTYDLMAQQGV